MKKAKASEIIEAYEKDKRDFQNLDLRGENFNKQKCFNFNKQKLSKVDLSGADF